MESEPEQRRNFTDVASLFQPIVPPPGAPVRQASASAPPLPPAVPDRVPEPVALPTHHPSDARVAPEVVPQGERAGPAEWAEAWDPKPNWRPRRSWSWVLLVPLGVFAAAAVLMADPAQLRHWFAEHVWHPEPARTPVVVPPPASPPAPASPVATPPLPVASPAPASAPAPRDPDAPPAATPPQAASEPAPPPVEPPAPAEAPVPPSQPLASQPQDPPLGPQGAGAPAAAPSFGAIAIRYRRGQPTADADVARLASQLQPLAERLEVRPGTTGYRTPTILYFRPEDRPAAISLSQVVTAPGGAWTIRVGQGRQRAGWLELWVP